MTEPASRVRAQRAQSYLDMLGIRPRGRRRPAVDVEIGEAQIEPTTDIDIGEARMEAPSEDERALEALAAAEPGRTRPDTSTTRRGELALAAGDTIPAEWLRDSRAESQASANARAEATRTQAAAEAARARSLADPGQRTRNVIAAIPEGPGRALGQLARGPLTGPLVQGLTYLPGRYLDDDTLDASLHGTTQGLTLGLADEIVGATTPYDETYEEARDRVRRQQDEAQRDAPLAYGAFEVAGGMVPALAIPSAGPGASLTRRVLTSGAAGAGFGGVAGGGHSRADFGTPEFRSDVLRGGAIGGALGGGTELGMAGARRLVERFGPVPAGTPRGGRDFTPEQQAQIGSDPALRRLDTRRADLELEAASHRVQSAYPNITRAELDSIEATHPGGLRGLARDMDEAGIAPRRSFGTPGGVQARVAEAARPDPLGGARAGRFNDDVTVGPLPSGATPSRRHPAADWAPDPEDAYPFDPEMTMEAQANRIRDAERARAAERVAGRNATMTDAERIAAEEVTPRPARPGARTPPAAIPTDAFQSVMHPPVSPETQALIDQGAVADDAFDMFPVSPETRASIERSSAQAAPAARRTAEAERQFQARQSFERQYGGAPVATPARGVRTAEDVAADRQANILAAERRRERGARSLSTHDERTWPVRAEDVEDITPQAAPPATPPPLPRRAAPARDLGRWDAPPSELAQVAPEPTPLTPRQRAGETLEPLRRRDLLARTRREEGVLAAPRRTVEDLARRWLPLESGRASIAEFRSDAIAADIMRRLSTSPATTPYQRALAAAAERGPRAFGVTLVRLANRHPEVQEAIAPLLLATQARAVATEVGRSGPQDPNTGLPYSDTYVEGQAPAGDDEEEFDYGIPYADETDEEYQLRMQGRRQQ